MFHHQSLIMKLCYIIIHHLHGKIRPVSGNYRKEYGNDKGKDEPRTKFHSDKEQPFYNSPGILFFHCTNRKKELKYKFYAKIRLYTRTAFTTFANHHRKFQIPVIYNMNILSILLYPAQNIFCYFFPIFFSTDEMTSSCKLFKIYNAVRIFISPCYFL